MTRKAGWEKSTSGPDWIDVEAMMRSMEAVHSGHVAVIISPDGIGSTGGVDVATSIIFNVLPGSSLPTSVVTHSVFPCNTHSTLAQHAYEGLHRLDFEIGQTYKNEALWK